MLWPLNTKHISNDLYLHLASLAQGATLTSKPVDSVGVHLQWLTTMPKSAQSQATADQLCDSFPALPQSAIEKIEGQQGSLKDIITDMDAAVRKVDQTGTPTKLALEKALKEWDG
eukprot:6277465-Karenia_brevis.AAC.1